MTTELLSRLQDRRWPVGEASEEQIKEEFHALPKVANLKGRLTAMDEQISLEKQRKRTAADPALRRLIVESEVLRGEYEDLWQALYPSLKRGLNSPPFAGMQGMSRGETGQRNQLIGHSLFALLSGLVGGMIAVRFHRTRDDENPCPDDRSNSDRSTT